MAKCVVCDHYLRTEEELDARLCVEHLEELEAE